MQSDEVWWCDQCSTVIYVVYTSGQCLRHIAAITITMMAVLVSINIRSCEAGVTSRTPSRTPSQSDRPWLYPCSNPVHAMPRFAHLLGQLHRQSKQGAASSSSSSSSSSATAAITVAHTAPIVNHLDDMLHTLQLLQQQVLLRETDTLLY